MSLERKVKIFTKLGAAVIITAGASIPASLGIYLPMKYANEGNIGKAVIAGVCTTFVSYAAGYNARRVLGD